MIRIHLKKIFLAIIGVALLLLFIDKISGKNMPEIKFDLGKNIVETAKNSGVPRFGASDVNGFISYSVNSIPPSIPAHYARKDYEIIWQPIFAFAMHTDKKRAPNLEVESAGLQLDKTFESDKQAQEFIESTIAQFQKGKWERYHDSEYTLVTGRSSLLDENNRISSYSTAIDPDYKISSEDWVVLVREGAFWRWVGDGVLAKLTVNASKRENMQALQYDVNLDFNLLDVKLKRDAENLATELKEGDAKGWNSTRQHEANKKSRLADLKIMEANALKRGDRVLTPH